MIGLFTSGIGDSVRPGLLVFVSIILKYSILLRARCRRRDRAGNIFCIFFTSLLLHRQKVLNQVHCGEEKGLNGQLFQHNWLGWNATTICDFECRGGESFLWSEGCGLDQLRPGDKACGLLNLLLLLGGD